MKEGKRSPHRTLRAVWTLLRAAFEEWQKDKISRQAAALAYFTVFSLVPLLLMVLSVAGGIFGQQTAERQLLSQLEEIVGPESARAVVTLIGSLQNVRLGRTGIVIGMVALLWGASNVFYQLKDVLNTIWQVEPKPGQGWQREVVVRAFSMLMVFGMGFLLLLSLIIAGAVAALKQVLANGLVGLPAFITIWTVNVLLGFGINSLLFAAVFRLLPDAKIAWGDVWVGAGMTAALFTLGQLLIGSYLGSSRLGAALGTPGAVVIILFWIYWSAQTLFFGAELTWVYANRYGSRIVPKVDAQPLMAESRARQGVDRPLRDEEELRQRTV